MGGAAGGDEVWPESEEDKDDQVISDTYGMVLTFAAKLGQKKPPVLNNLTFADRFA